MAPAASLHVNSHADGTTNGTTLKATAPSFHPTGTPDPSKYHAASTDEAIHSEKTHAAHNYHPLPIVFSRAAGCSVWDPEGKEYVTLRAKSLFDTMLQLAKPLTDLEADLVSLINILCQMFAQESC